MVTLKSNEFWGARSGAYSGDVPKGHNQPWGNVFKQQQWSAGNSRSGKQKSLKLSNVNKAWFK